VIFSEIWPSDLGFPNRAIGKGQIGEPNTHVNQNVSAKNKPEK
jgi:hypothetical protein